MRPSSEAPRVLRLLEGERCKPYKDTGGLWTAGVGHVIHGKPAPIYSRETIDKWLTDDLRQADRALADLVPIPLTQGQVDALCIFIFNIGRAAFARSTLRKALLARDDHEVRLQWIRWVYDDGVRYTGLALRRMVELTVYDGLSPMITSETLERWREQIS